MSAEERRSNWVTFTIGAVVGAVTGAIAGIILAPQAGAWSREQTADWLKGKSDSGAEILSRIRKQGMHRKNQLTAAWQAGRHAYTQSVVKHG